MALVHQIVTIRETLFPCSVTTKESTAIKAPDCWRWVPSFISIFISDLPCGQANHTTLILAKSTALQESAKQHNSIIPSICVTVLRSQPKLVTTLLFSKVAFPEDRDCSNECKHFHCRYTLSGFRTPSSIFCNVHIPYCLPTWALIRFLLNRLFWLLSSHDKPSPFFSPKLFSLHSSLCRSERDTSRIYHRH